MKSNKYAIVEGMLYSYKNYPFIIKNLEIKYKLEKDETILEEIEKEKLKFEKVDNMLEFLKANDLDSYYIIYYRYIEKLEWKIVLGKLLKHDIIYNEKVAITKRTEAIKKYLIGMV